MNQPFSAQRPSSFVGATLAVALGKQNQPFSVQGLTNIVGVTLAVTLLNHECGRPDKASKGRPKIDCKMQHTCNISLLTQPLERDHYCSGQGYMTNFDRDIIKVAELDDLEDGE